MDKAKTPQEISAAFLEARDAWLRASKAVAEAKSELNRAECEKANALTAAQKARAALDDVLRLDDKGDQ
jgi:hypothetical protein